jgi:hypothetical protein
MGRAIPDGTGHGDRSLDQFLAARLTDLPELDTAPFSSGLTSGPGWVMSAHSSAGGDGASLTSLTGLGLGDATLDVGSNGPAEPGLTVSTRALAAAALLTTYVGLRAMRERDKKRTGQVRPPICDGTLLEVNG